MDCRDLALQAAEQINNSNWIQEETWETIGSQRWPDMEDSWEDEVVQPFKACVVGHLYWVARDQGLTFSDARKLVNQVYYLALSHRPLVTHNDDIGRTADQVKEHLRQIATE